MLTVLTQSNPIPSGGGAKNKSLKPGQSQFGRDRSASPANSARKTYPAGARRRHQSRGDRHALAGLFRQSVFGRLAGYQDVNDAGHLCHDPTMRWIVGGDAAQRSTASPSQMGRFETQWLAAPKNFAALADLGLASGSTLCMAEGRRVALCSTWIRA